MDPVFSARDLQDVKVIFEPVEYVIFHGLSSADSVTSLEFVRRPPETRTEDTVTAVEDAIRNCKVKLETLHNGMLAHLKCERHCAEAARSHGTEAAGVAAAGRNRLLPLARLRGADPVLALLDAKKT